MINDKIATINLGILAIPPIYLFDEIKQLGTQYETEHPKSRQIIDAGIGNTKLPLVPEVVDAGVKAMNMMGIQQHYRGYGPEIGYDDLRETISLVDFHSRGITKINEDNIFVSTGTKEDSATFPDIFNRDVPVLVVNPAYPVYVNAALIAGRKIVYITANDANEWCPEPPRDEYPGAIIWLCYPNNPTGQTANREYLARWVAYAKKCQATILYDNAYVEFISSPNVVRSIFEIEDAWDVAIEFRSFSKPFGFTNVRCAYAIIGNATLYGNSGDAHLVRDLWARYKGYKTNGVFWVIQQMAMTAMTTGREACMTQVRYYLRNAKVIGKELDYLGLEYVGGIDSPYLWVKTPKGMYSKSFCELLIEKAQIVATPGEGFVSGGTDNNNDAKKRIRISSFMFKENADEMSHRLRRLNI